jgi:hypothetical protein
LGNQFIGSIIAKVSTRFCGHQLEMLPFFKMTSHSGHAVALSSAIGLSIFHKVWFDHWHQKRPASGCAVMHTFQITKVSYP